MSNTTSVISPAEGPPTHESSAKRVEEELANRVKNTGDGMGAIRRHGGTVLVIYGVQRKDFKDFAGC
jgi:hypothetical protein